MKNARYSRWEWLIILLTVFFCATVALAADKNLFIAWEQDEVDLPSVDYWKLFSSTDELLPFDQWKDEGNIPYVVGMPLISPIVINAPDGQETNFWFKMTVVDKDGLSSDPSVMQENAPTLIDFKPPVPAVLAGNYDNKTKTVTLTWPINPSDTDINSQKVYKATCSGCPYTEIGEAASPYSYIVQPSDSGKWLYFVVVLIDDDGNFSQNSNEVAVKLSMGVPFNVRVTVSAQ